MNSFRRNREGLSYVVTTDGPPGNPVTASDRNERGDSGVGGGLAGRRGFERLVRDFALDGAQRGARRITDADLLVLPVDLA